ncbi:PulJ/GspJ family protein [Chrysiogenes arsenatis]|uniref:PulJ/GspJ family protein n=1 Tax=Chrysiogenes arsenatis TaxID=309797 RepID=UPI000406ACF6|nr:prepilin-type N-terminal cleavage/methylation domain-containing protein [Chrysiogenes arsenatis]
MTTANNKSSTKKGFTLIEVMVASIVGAVAIMTLWSVASAIQRGYASLEEGENRFDQIAALDYFFSHDMRQLSGRAVFVGGKLEISTDNSFLDVPPPLTVSYYVEKVREENWLFRREQGNLLEAPIAIPLASGIQEVKIFFHRGNRTFTGWGYNNLAPDKIEMVLTDESDREYRLQAFPFLGTTYER